MRTSRCISQALPREGGASRLVPNPGHPVESDSFVRDRDLRLAPNPLPSSIGMTAPPPQLRTSQFPANRAGVRVSPNAGKRAFARVHDDPLHKSRSVARARVSSLPVWFVQPWMSCLLLYLAGAGWGVLAGAVGVEKFTLGTWRDSSVAAK